MTLSLPKEKLRQTPANEASCALKTSSRSWKMRAARSFRCVSGGSLACMTSPVATVLLLTAMVTAASATGSAVDVKLTRRDLQTTTGVTFNWTNAYWNFRTSVASNGCIDITWNSPDVGARLQQWGCNSGAAQSFTMIAHPDGSYSIKTARGLCWQVVGSGTTAGTAVEQASCSSVRASQRFDIKPAGIRKFALRPKHTNNMCLDVRYSSPDNGTPIQLWSCNGGAAQQFNLTLAPVVITTSTAPGMCLDIPLNSASSGTGVQQYQCNDSPAQIFTPVPAAGSSGYYYNLVTTAGLCLGVSMSGTADGTTLVQRTCQPTSPAQSFMFITHRGGGYEIRPQHAAHKTLDVGNDGTGNGVVIWIWTPNSSSAQRFRLAVPSTTKAFSHQVISDTQLWWFRGQDGRGGGRAQQEGERTNKQLYETLAARRSPVHAGVVINGDQTSYGHQDEWNKYNEIWRSKLVRSGLYYPGLGNHDITNNHPASGGGCSYWSLPPLNLPVCGVVAGYGYTTCCSATMLTIQKRDLEGYISKPQGLLSISPEGSAYSWARDGYRFLQLNYNPALNWLTALNAFYTPPLGPYFDWLEGQLAAARTSGQNVVIYIHTLSALTGAPYDRFKRAITNTPVSLIFVGHCHECFGQQNVIATEGGNVPVIYSGAAEYLSYIDAVYGSQTITVALQLARSGGQRRTVAQWTFNLGPGGKVTNPYALGMAFMFNKSNQSDHEPSAANCSCSA